MIKNNIILTPTQFYVVEGEYEGFKYYHLCLETEEGMVLKKKLTQFEYTTLLQNYSD